jgi:ribosomal protein L31E
MFDGKKSITNESTTLLIPKEVTGKVLGNKEFGFEIRKYAQNHLNDKDSFTNIMLTELINREVSSRGAIQKCLKLMCTKNSKNKYLSVILTIDIGNFLYTLANSH